MDRAGVWWEDGKGVSKVKAGNAMRQLQEQRHIHVTGKQKQMECKPTKHIADASKGLVLKLFKCFPLSVLSLLIWTTHQGGLCEAKVNVNPGSSEWP